MADPWHSDADADSAVSRWRRAARHALPDADVEVVEEVAQHVAERWLRARYDGLSEGLADAQARRELDGWRGVRLPAPVPARRIVPPWRGWGCDARFALRSLRLRPLFTVGSILLAAIAAVSNVTVFTIVYGILWRPLPYPESDRLAVLWQVRGGEQGQISYPDFVDLTRTTVFDTAAAVWGGVGSLRIGETIERVNVI